MSRNAKVPKNSPMAPTKSLLKKIMNKLKLKTTVDNVENTTRKDNQNISSQRERVEEVIKSKDLYNT